jgi:signal transduction histidine kinase
MVMAGLVHDLGNLLQIAYSAIGLARRAPEVAAARSELMLERAEICLAQAGMLVRQNLRRLHDRPAAPDRCDILRCISDVVAVVGTMNEGGLVLDIEVDSSLPALECDPIGLRRAITNLVLNAFDAQGGKGTVRIRARAASRGADGVMLSVADRGSGMTPAVLARIFDPAFTTKKDGLGGLGLPMVRHFVRNAGGDIAVESKPGDGTTVSLWLPALAALHPADRPHVGNPAAKETMR